MLSSHNGQMQSSGPGLVLDRKNSSINEGLDPIDCMDEVTRILTQEAYSHRIESLPGVSRHDGAQLASNSPCEDRHVCGQLLVPWDSKPWLAWAVFDGHAGWQTAQLLSEEMLPYVQRGLSQLQPDSPDVIPDDNAIHRAIMEAFTDLDDSIINTAHITSQIELPLHQKMRKLLPAFSGSCALLSVYDPSGRKLHVACTGDCRAVHGCKEVDGKWQAVPLSVDQSGSNEEEIARINQEHPGEEDISQDGRMLGLMVSRAFGDGQWKWPLELQEEFVKKFHGPAPLTHSYDVKTPPYLTAEPVVTTTTVDSERPSFLILATDGLWENLTNEQAVDLIGEWLKPRSPAGEGAAREPTYPPVHFGQLDEGVSSEFVAERTTVQDDNAAVHLMRNSLGGNHRELIAGRLAIGFPFSRYVRDDISAHVIFF